MLTPPLKYAYICLMFPSYTREKEINTLSEKCQFQLRDDTFSWIAKKRFLIALEI